jgi:hypothetical protein
MSRIGQRSHQLRCMLPKLFLYCSVFYAGFNPVDACDHPRHITVDQRCSLCIRNRCNGTGGIRTDTRNASEFSSPGRKLAVELTSDIFSACM